ncbi:MAG: hypothetical protein R3F33_14605 [Planctomycetota bacterium]
MHTPALKSWFFPGSWLDQWVIGPIPSQFVAEPVAALRKPGTLPAPNGRVQRVWNRWALRCLEFMDHAAAWVRPVQALPIPVRVRSRRR